MSNELDGKRIAFLTANEGVEQVELTEPWTIHGGGASGRVDVDAVAGSPTATQTFQLVAARVL